MQLSSRSGVIGEYPALPSRVLIMKITVRLFTTLTSYLPPESDGTSFQAEIEAGATVHELIARVGIPARLPHIVMVNAHRVSPGNALKDGDTVSLFPAIGGG